MRVLISVTRASRLGHLLLAYDRALLFCYNTDGDRRIYTWWFLQHLFRRKPLPSYVSSF